MEHTPTTTAPNVIDLILDTVFVVDVNGMIVSASGGCEAMLGYTPAELKGRRMLDMVAPEDVERTQAAAKSVIAGSQFLHFENRYVRKDGALVDLMWSAKWSEAEQARVGVARDVTERKREERLSKAIHEIAEATLANDTLDGLTQHLCSVLRSLIPAARCIFVQAGLHGSEDEQQAQGRAFVSQMQALGSARAQAMSVGVGVGGGGDAGGHSSVSDWLCMPISSAEGISGAAFLIRGPEEQKFSANELQWAKALDAHVSLAIERCRTLEKMAIAATRDELTGLPNRASFQTLLSQAIAKGPGPGGLALLFMDLDQFKKVNDSFGHECGDAVLSAFARRIEQACEGSGISARLGGDEFAVLVEGAGSLDRAKAIERRLSLMMEQYMDCGPQLLIVSPSIGIASFPEDGSDPASMLRSADAAMYAAKSKSSRA